MSRIQPGSENIVKNTFVGSSTDKREHQTVMKIKHIHSRAQNLRVFGRQSEKSPWRAGEYAVACEQGLSFEGNQGHFDRFVP